MTRTGFKRPSTIPVCQYAGTFYGPTRHGDLGVASGAMTDALPRSTRIGYAMGSLATGAFGTVPGLLLLPYLTDNLGVAAGVAGLLVLLPKAWDVLLNPVAGRISDRTKSRWGPRRPYLLFAGVAMALLFAGMFAAPMSQPGWAAAWCAIAFFLTATGFAFFQVPYVAMPAEITDGYAERTRLMTWRVAILAVAILVSGAVAPLVVTATGGGIAGHRWMGGFVAVLIAVGAIGAFLGTRNAPISGLTANEPSLRAQLAIARRNRPFVILVTVFVVQTVGIATMLAGVKYVADHVIGRPDDGATFLFACFVGPALLVMPLWNRVGAVLGKNRSLTLAAVLMSIAAALLVTAWWVPATVVYLIVAVMGIGYAGQQVFAMAMLPDCIAYDTAKTKRRQAGVFTGLWTAGETLGLALGPGVFAAVLTLGGYLSSAGELVVQPASARWAILLGFTVIPAVLIGPITVLLSRYDLTETKMDAVTADESTRRAELG